MENFIQLFLLAFLGSIIALVGGVVFLFNKNLSRVLEKYSIPFAAGVLITVALVGILPEALELVGNQALTVILFSFLGSFLFENFLFSLHHHEEHHHRHDLNGSSALVIVGDTIHNFIDGIAIGASFLVNPGLGLITAVSTFLHEVPHEIGDFGVLLKAGWKKKNVFLINLISSSFAIVGAFFVLFVSEDKALIGNFLAVAAGIFLYLGAVDFLPHVLEHDKSRARAILPLVIGCVVMLAVIMMVPHVD